MRPSRHRYNSAYTLQRIATIAGTGNSAPEPMDGTAAVSANVYGPSGVWADTLGTVYYSDVLKKIRKIDALSGTVATVAGGTGSDPIVSDIMHATSADIGSVLAIGGDSVGKIYMSDRDNYQVCMVDLHTGLISLFAGPFQNGRDGDGYAASSTTFYYPRGIWAAPNGDVYVVEYDRLRVRKVDHSNGLVFTVAGSTNTGSDIDGPATSVPLNSPNFICGDSASQNLYITTQDGVIRKVTLTNGPSMMYTLMAANGGYIGNEPAAVTSAVLSLPQGVIIDSNGDLYVAEESAHRIKKVTMSTQMVTTIAGTGVASDTATATNGDGGEPTAATLNSPYMIGMFVTGEISFSDSGNNKIRKLYNPSPTSMPSQRPTSRPTAHRFNSEYTFQQIRTVVGTGSTSMADENVLAAETNIDSPTGVWSDSFDNLYCFYKIEL